MKDKSIANLLARHGMPPAVAEAFKGMVTAETNPLTGGRVISLPSGSQAASQIPFVSGLSVVGGTLYFNGAYCRELGVNAFSLLINQLSSGGYAYRALIDDLVARKIRIARIVITGTTATEVLNNVHGGTLKMPYRWSDLSSTYRNAITELFDYAASKGLYLLPNVHWTISLVSTMWSETPSTAFADARSKTREYLRVFAATFARQFKDHPALAGYACANEIDLNGPQASISAVNYRAAMAEIATALRSQDPRHAILSGNCGPIYDGTQTRLTFDAVMADKMLDHPDPIDVIDCHGYADRAYIGDNPANHVNTLSLDIYTYARDWYKRYKWEAANAGKAFAMTETGVVQRSGSTGQEPLGETTRIEALCQKIFDSGCQLALLWNYGESVWSGQAAWDFGPASSRHQYYMPVITKWAEAMRSAQPNPRNERQFYAARTGYPCPAGALVCSGSNNHNLQYAGNAALNAMSGTVLLWIRKTSTPPGFARVMTNASGTGGFTLIYDAAGDELYCSLTTPTGTEARNSVGHGPKGIANGTWAMLGFTWNGAEKITAYRDGHALSGVNNPYTYGGNGTSTLFIGTNTTGFNGAPVNIAGIVFAPRVMTSNEIADYYLRGSVPDDAWYIPMTVDGSTSGLLTVTPTSQNGVTFAASGM